MGKSFFTILFVAYSVYYRMDGWKSFSAMPVFMYGVNLLVAAIAYFILQFRIIKNRKWFHSQKKLSGKISKEKYHLYYIYCASGFIRWYADCWGIVLLLLLIWLIPDKRIENHGEWRSKSNWPNERFSLIYQKLYVRNIRNIKFWRSKYGSGITSGGCKYYKAQRSGWWRVCAFQYLQKHFRRKIRWNLGYKKGKHILSGSDHILNLAFGFRRLSILGPFCKRSPAVF